MHLLRLFGTIERRDDEQRTIEGYCYRNADAGDGWVVPRDVMERMTAEYMKFANVEESKLYEDAKEPSLRQVKLNLALTEIIKVENIEATDEEIEAEYERAAKMYGMDAESLKSYITKDAVADEVKRDKAVKLITESAIAADAAAAEPEKKPAKKRTTKKKAEAAPAEEKTEEKAE